MFNKNACSFFVRLLAFAALVVCTFGGPQPARAAAPSADLRVTKDDGRTTVNAGDTTTYTIVVTNYGPDPADGAVFNDDPGAGLNATAVSCGTAIGGAVCPTGPNTTVALMQAQGGPGIVIPTLPNGGSVTFTVTATVTATSGNVTNNARAADPAGTTDPGPDNQHAVDTDKVTPLTLVKTIVSGSPYSAVGNTIVYNYVVTNTSRDHAVGGPVTITDDKLTNVYCPPLSTIGNGNANLDPQESITCTVSHTVTQADLTGDCLLTNRATAHAGAGVVVDSNEAQATARCTQRGPLTLVKSIRGGNPYGTVGGIIVYQYLVTNTGNLSLPNPITITDDQATDESCPSTSTVGNGDANFDPGESMTCTASHTVTQADLDAGSLTNHATAHAGDTSSNQSQATACAVYPFPRGGDNRCPHQLPRTGFMPGAAEALSGLPAGQLAEDLGMSLDLPRLGLYGMPIVGVPLIAGTWDVNWLGDNAGWLETTAMPGQPGNSVVSGHVTDIYGYAGPFWQLYSLTAGDDIMVRASGQVYTYRVQSVGDFSPDDLSILQDEAGSVLTLVTCSDPNWVTHTYDGRLVVRAALVQQMPQQ